MRAHSKKKNKFAALKSITKKLPDTTKNGNFWAGKLPDAKSSSSSEGGKELVPVKEKKTGFW
jgi:hypothetical protein